MGFNFIPRNGYIFTEHGVSKGDLAIKDGKITAISYLGPLQSEAANELDVTEQYVLPGLIDSHVHLNEPGRTDWEGFESRSKSLAAGGVTTFFDMPLNVSLLQLVKKPLFKKFNRIRKVFDKFLSLGRIGSQ